MNMTVLSGRVCTIPKIKLLQIEEQQVSICLFTVAIVDGVFATQDYKMEETNIDYFECVAFGEAAIMINANFVKGSKIICKGRMKNHIFNDVNGTKHFTNVFVVRKKSIELSVVSDLQMLFNTYKKVCENGFLCIDEEEYYKIAMMCM